MLPRERRLTWGDASGTARPLEAGAMWIGSLDVNYKEYGLRIEVSDGQYCASASCHAGEA